MIVVEVKYINNVKLYDYTILLEIKKYDCKNIAQINQINNVNTTLKYKKNFYVDKIVNAKQATMSFFAEVIPPLCRIILHLQYSRSFQHCVVNEGGPELPCMTGTVIIVIVTIIINTNKKSTEQFIA